MLEAGSRVAPYWRFRPNWLPDQVAAGESLQAEVQGCNWTCESCWSRYGWLTLPPIMELEPEAVVRRLQLDMERYDLTHARITGGEPALHWKHMVEVMKLFTSQSKRRFILETNGSFLRPQDFIELDELLGPRSGRVAIVIGMKSTSAVGLAQLTGLPLGVAERRHRRQLENVAAVMRTGMDAWATFLDHLTEPEVYADLHGRGVKVSCIQYRKFGNASRFYKPKRFRRQHHGQA